MSVWHVGKTGGTTDARRTTLLGTAGPEARMQGTSVQDETPPVVATATVTAVAKSDAAKADARLATADPTAVAFADQALDRLQRRHDRLTARRGSAGIGRGDATDDQVHDDPEDVDVGDPDPWDPLAGEDPTGGNVLIGVE